MAEEQRISDILIQWDRQRQAGEELSAADLCSDCPELTSEVASRIQALKNTDWMFGDDTAEDDAFLSLPNEVSTDTSPTSAQSIELPTTKLTADDFSDAISNAGLSIDSEIAAVREELPNGHAAADLARELIWHGQLTVFQASTLLKQEPLLLMLGDYEIRNRIGAGGMGEVYMARHRRMKRVVALKILPAELTDDEAALKRFNREVEIVASLEHPNIVTAHDAGEQDGTHYLIMQYVDGCDLATLVRTGGELSVNLAVDFTLQAARGLAHAHQQGVIHRDIKPSNILINKSGQVKILDLGLARVELPAAQQIEQRDGLTTTGAVMGTVDYMAPEQAVNTRTADHRADIYSLGCTLHFLLTGEPPYSGETMMERLLAHREQDIPSLLDRRDDVPAELDAIFRQLLAKQPDERFASMTDVVAVLESLSAESTGAPAGSSGRDSSSSTLPDELVVSQGVAPEDSATELYNQPVVATAQQKLEPDIQSPDETLNQSTAGTDPTLAPTVIKPLAPIGTAGSPGSDSAMSALPDKPAVPPRRRRGHLKWIALAVLLLGTAFYAASPLFKVKTSGGTLVFEGDPAVLQNATVTINGEEVDLNIDGKEFTVGVSKRSGEVRIVGANGVPLLSKSFTFEVGEDRLPLTVSVPDTADDAADPPPPKLAEWQPGPVDDALPGLIPRPAKFEGIKRWQIEARTPRTQVTSVDVSPDGKLVACGCNGGLVRIYDATTLELVELIHGEVEKVAAVAWSPDGKWLASDDLTTIQLWSPIDGTAKRIDLDGQNEEYQSISWAPDSSHLATSNGSVRIVDINTENVTILPQQGLVLPHVDWSPDGSWVAAGGYQRADGEPGAVLVWDVENQKAIATGEAGGHVNDLMWHPDSHQFVTSHAEPRNSTIRIWNLEANVEQTAQGVEGDQVKALSWSPDGNRIAAAGLQIRLIDLLDNSQSVTLSTLKPTSGLCWNAAGARIVTAHADGVRFWSSGGLQVATIAGSESMTSTGPEVEWSHDGSHLAFCLLGRTDRREVRVIAKSGTARRAYPDHGRFTWHPQRTMLTLMPGGSDKRFFGVDIDSHVQPFELTSNSAPVNSIAWSPDGKRMALGHQEAANDGAIEIWEPQGKRLALSPGHGNGRVYEISWSPDSRQFVSVGNGGIKVWNADGSEFSHIGDVGDSRAVAWSPTGEWIAASGGGDGGVRLFKPDHTEGPAFRSSKNIVTIAWSPDGEKLVGGGEDRETKVWSKDGQLLANLKGHRNSISSVAWSPNGTHFASVARDCTVIVWDGDTYEPVWAGTELFDGTWTSFTAGGQIIDGAPEVLADHFVYIVEHNDGRHELLKPSEFEECVGQSLRYEQPAVSPAVSPDWKIAETVIRLGGHVNIDGGELIERPADLAMGDFHVTGIYLRPDASHGNKIVVKDGALSGIERLSKLEHLNLTGPWVTDELAATIARIDSVLSVLIGGSQVTNRSLEHLARLPDLRHLQIESDLVDDEGLEFVGQMSDLTNFYCTSRSITDEGLANLSSLRHLTLLHLGGCSKITDGAIQSIKNRRQIEDWNLAQTKIADEGVQQILSDAESLQALNLNKTDITDPGLAGIDQHKELRLLLVRNTTVSGEFLQGIHKKLPNCRIEWDGGVIEPTGDKDRTAAEWILSVGGIVEAFAPGHGRRRYPQDGELPAEDLFLTHIDLSNTTPNWPAEIPVTGLPHLERLFLNGSHISDAQFQQISDLPELQEITTGQGTSLSDASLKLLTRFPQLQSLQCNVTSDAGVESLSQLKSLKKLHLNSVSNSVSPQSLQLLARIENLEELRISGGEKITWSALTPLAQLPKLERLALNLNSTLESDAQGMQSLAAFDDLSSLMLLRLQFADPTLQHLPVLNHLEELNVAFSNLDDRAAVKMGQFTKLSRLTLFGNAAMSDESLVHFQNLSQLSELDLIGTSVTRAGAEALSQSLPNCRIQYGPEENPLIIEPAGTSN